jgi:hypothetical protein
MRENRPSGSEGGGIEVNRFSLPLFDGRPFGAGIHVHLVSLTFDG